MPGTMNRMNQRKSTEVPGRVRLEHGISQKKTGSCGQANCAASDKSTSYLSFWCLSTIVRKERIAQDGSCIHELFY
jgi:hypothetical protein